VVGLAVVAVEADEVVGGMASFSLLQEARAVAKAMMADSMSKGALMAPLFCALRSSPLVRDSGRWFSKSSLSLSLQSSS
jgi:hypothetical protein